MGDATTGKTSLITQYILNQYEDDYIETRIDCFEKDIEIKMGPLTLSIWDLGGSPQFQEMREKNVMIDTNDDYNHRLDEINDNILTFLMRI